MISSFFWRPLPIATLTVRQFLGGKAVRIVTLLSLIPSLFAVIGVIAEFEGYRVNFLEDLFSELIVPTMLPITTMTLATAALGNETEDRTLPYLTLKPVSRLRIIWEKLLGVLVVALPTILGGIALTSAIVGIFGEDRPLLGRRVVRPELTDVLPVALSMLAASAIGIVAISALFLLVSLVIPRALLVGIVYTLIWESALARFIPGVWVASIKHYVVSIFVGLIDDPSVQLDNAVSVQTGILTLASVAVVCILLATWRLRAMNLE